MTDKVEALGNAEEIAKLTGRSKAEVIEDLLDDGKLNNSNAIKENTSAIDRATDMANKTHKLLTALIPILLLISTSGLELTGIIDLTPAGNGEDDEWFWEDEEYEEYWGCTDWDAVNYDEYATDDDGSCEYDEEIIYGCTDPEANNYNDEATSEDDSCEYDPEECEPFYYDYYLSYVDSNNSSLIYTYDIDLPCDETQEVEVQFLAYVNGSGHGDLPYNYTIDKFNTTYQDWDSRTVILSDFENDTYDIYAYLINDNGDMIKESTWFNVQLKARDE